MFDLDKWQEILSTMGKNPLRTILTSVSVAVGIFMLVVLLGLGQGLQNGVNSTLGDDAVNSIWIRSGRTSLPYMGYKSNRRVQYHNDDHDYVVENMDGVATSSSRLAFWGTAIKWKNKSSDYNIRCVHPGHQEVEKTLVATGRYISEKDVAEARKVAVIGQAIVDEFFEGYNPLGEFMEVKGIQFRIVGTFNDPNSRWENRQIYLPITTGQKLFGSGNDAINMFIVSTGTSSFDRSEQLTEEIDGYLHAKHKVAPADQRGIKVRNLNEEAKKINDIFMGIDIFLIGMGFFTLIAGIISVSNIMSIVVRERTKEIGVRKALGASPWSVISLILQESVFITLVSGCVGLLVGVGLLELLAGVIDHDFFRNPRINVSYCLMALGLLVVAGALSGLVPAMRAARIKPVVALRHE